MWYWGILFARAIFTALNGPRDMNVAFHLSIVRYGTHWDWIDKSPVERHNPHSDRNFDALEASGLLGSNF